MTSTVKAKMDMLRNARIVRRIVCEYYNVPVATVMKPGRPATQHIARTKHVICYLMRKVCGTTAQYTAEMLNLKSHASCRLADIAVKDQMDVYPQFKNEVEMLEYQCWKAIK